MRMSDWSSDVCSSDLRRSAIAAPMPREAPVTIATLFAFVAICVLLRDVRRSAVVEEIMALLVWRIIVHYSALLSDKSEQKYGPFRCHAGFRPRCLTPQFHAGGRRQTGRASCRERVCRSV